MIEKLYGPKPSQRQMVEFGEILADLSGREDPWSPSHLYNVLHEYVNSNGNPFFVSDELWTGLTLVKEYGLRVGGLVRKGLVSSHPLPPGTIIQGKAVKCEGPGCELWFVPTAHNKKYHSKKCGRRAKEARRKQRQGDTSE